MRILAIDPGTATTGYAVIDAGAGTLRAVTWGAWRTDSRQPTPSRLLTLHKELDALIECYRPAELAIEKLFFNRNVTSALAVGQARGVVLMTAAARGLPVREFTPAEVKQAVTGLGRAAKQQVGYMVKALLGLAEIPQPDDVADALAVGICCAHTASDFGNRVGNGLGSDVVDW